LELATCYFAKFDSSMGHAVRITRYPPRWQPPWPLAGTIRELAPHQAWALRSDWPAFEAAYRAQLEKVGVDKITQLIEQVVPSGIAVLLCFEKDPARCHRGLFASYWVSKTGREVLEIDATPTPTLDPERPQALLLPFS
jgi:Protein of unknown function, DUF488